MLRSCSPRSASAAPGVPAAERVSAWPSQSQRSWPSRKAEKLGTYCLSSSSAARTGASPVSSAALPSQLQPICRST
ncbi:hypothetical protein [Paenibacillus sp. P46E]|uniref:hypothetical protein n=1 Tax=Paenibacillus sp. P46E TaxID=1349436 RepID=UPI002116ADBB|nr:hypothetical protein [Paenibacillus sp. P46E]